MNVVDNWKDVHDNFVTLLETTIGGYHESDKLDLTRKDAVPGSIFDKAYSLLAQSMPTPWRYINGQIDVLYNVRLTVCFELNLQDSKASYNAAVTAIETIIKSRLPQSSWGSTSIVMIEHKSTGQMLPVSARAQGSYVYTTIDFQVAARDILVS